MTSLFRIFDGDGVLLALVQKRIPDLKGVNFVTPDELSQQVAHMARPSGYRIEPHFHLLRERSVTRTLEVIIVISGSLRANIFCAAKKLVESVTIAEGDTILLVSGGHGFTALEDSYFIEVKQGPYVEGSDKVHFAPLLDATENGI